MSEPQAPTPSITLPTVTEATGHRRPTPEECVQALERMEQGDSAAEAARRLGIDRSSMNKMIHADPALRLRYAGARAARTQRLQDMALEVGVAAATGGKIEVNGELKDVTDSAGARVLLDAIKWVEGRMNPNGQPVQRVVVASDDLTREERKARIAELQAKARAEAEADEE